MKTGYYLLVLTCDAECDVLDQQWTGDSKEHAQERARDAGWQLGDEHDYCPRHVSH